MANKFTDAVFHAKVPAVDKAVLWAIAHRTDNETGVCYPTIKTISKEGGASSTIVKAVIAYAVAVGVLSVKNRKNGKMTLANEYTFNLKRVRWMTRADDRFSPDGEIDQGTRVSTAPGKFMAQAASQPGGRAGGGPRVGSLPSGEWGWRRLQNSEVDLRIRSRQSNSDSTETDTTADTDQSGTPGTYHSDMEAFRLQPTLAQQACEHRSGHIWTDVLHTTQQCSACGMFRTNPALLQWTAADDLEAEYMEFVEYYDPFDTYWSAPEKPKSTAANRTALSPSEFARAIGAVAHWD